MKFVYFGYDFMLESVRRLLREDHQLTGIFSFECDNVFNFNRDTVALAADLGIPVSLQKPISADIESYINQDCEIFLSAGYPFKIPPVNDARAYGINVHPSLLPKGRGLMPTPYIIMHHPEASGLTVHKLSECIDGGDILHQIELPVRERETVETLSSRIAMKAPDIISEIFSDISAYWKNAMPQDEAKASLFPPPDAKMRLLDWSAPVDEIDKTARAFGRYGSLAMFDGALWAVYAHDVWMEDHGYPPGTVAFRLSREIIIAAKDGFVCLKELEKAQL